MTWMVVCPPQLMQWNAFFFSLRDRLLPVSNVTIRTAQAVSRVELLKPFRLFAVNAMHGLAVIGRTMAEGTYRLGM